MRFGTKTGVTAAAIALAAALSIAPVRAADELPKAETLLDKYIEVTGGKAAYQKIHSEISTGAMEMGAMAIKAKLTTYQAEPSLVYTETVIDGIGKIQEGSDGKVAWSLSAIQGAHLKTGDELAEALREAKMHSDINWREYYPKVETVGMESVDGKDCYKVVATPKVGSPQTRFYDKQSNLLVKTARTVKSPMGEIAAETTLADYRKEGDILSPHKMISKAMGQEIKMTIESIVYNADIPKEKFDLPDEIKALVAKEK